LVITILTTVDRGYIAEGLPDGSEYPAEGGKQGAVAE